MDSRNVQIPGPVDECQKSFKCWASIAETNFTDLRRMRERSSDFFAVEIHDLYNCEMRDE